MGEHIPRYCEKRFAFARQNIFSPTIFQHQIDPGSSMGKGPFELLYGFRSYKGGSNSSSYDIGFSIEFDPAVYVKTKFVPLGGYVYYYFEDSSKSSSETRITFSSVIEKGSGESVELSLIFDKIDDSLGCTGRWMSFDIDIVGDHDPLGGKFHYRGSHEFSVGVVVDSPLFEEKIEINDIPKRVDVSWDLDFAITPTPNLFASASGFFEIEMSTPLGGISVYYPKVDPSDPDVVFIDVPGGIPSSVRVEAEAVLNVDLANPRSLDNYIYGRTGHSCSNNIQSITVFLPDIETPLVKVTDIPSYAEVKGELYWNRLQGYAYARRSSSGPPDPLEINIEYKGFKIHDVLTVRDGFIETGFKLAEQGYFSFDTSQKIFGNMLQVSKADTGDSLSLVVDEVSADDLQANWDIDTSGGGLEIKDLGFSGFIDTLKGLKLNVNYQGKSTTLNLDWTLGQTGCFQIDVQQEEDLTIDFDRFSPGGGINLSGGVTLSKHIQFDMSWKLKQGEETGDGSVDPGYFIVNQYDDQAIIKDFEFRITYQEKYGVHILFENLKFYLNLEWWKGNRLLPYIWLEYEVSKDEFDVHLLWTNGDGETQWYDNIEDW
jgi:hypothetical protein